MMIPVKFQIRRHASLRPRTLYHPCARRFISTVRNDIADRAWSHWQGQRHLWVYGSLRLHADNAYARWLARHARYLGPAWVRGVLYDLGRYPGLVIDDENGEWIEGDCFWLTKPCAVWRRLDHYEGSSYRRVLIPIHSRYGQSRAWCYVYRGSLATARRLRQNAGNPPTARF